MEPTFTAYIERLLPTDIAGRISKELRKELKFARRPEHVLYRISMALSRVEGVDDSVKELLYTRWEELGSYFKKFRTHYLDGEGLTWRRKERKLYDKIRKRLGEDPPPRTKRVLNHRCTDQFRGEDRFYAAIISGKYNVKNLNRDLSKLDTVHAMVFLELIRDSIEWEDVDKEVLTEVALRATKRRSGESRDVMSDRLVGELILFVWRVFEVSWVPTDLVELIVRNSDAHLATYLLNCSKIVQPDISISTETILSSIESSEILGVSRLIRIHQPGKVLTDLPHEWLQRIFWRSRSSHLVIFLKEAGNVRQLLPYVFSKRCDWWKVYAQVTGQRVYLKDTEYAGWSLRSATAVLRLLAEKGVPWEEIRPYSRTISCALNHCDVRPLYVLVRLLRVHWGLDFEDLPQDFKLSLCRVGDLRYLRLLLRELHHMGATWEDLEEIVPKKGVGYAWEKLVRFVRKTFGVDLLE